jgi:hypothetical protein
VSDADLIARIEARDAALARLVEQGGPAPGLGRSFALGARNVVEGVSAFPGMVYDAAAVPVNLAADALGLPRARSGRENVGAVLDAAGAPRAQTSQERLVGRVVQEGAGLLTTGGAGAALANAGGRVARGVGAALTSAPVSQVAGATGAGLAAGTVQEAGGGGGAELAAGLLGGVAGGAAPALARAGYGVGAAALQPLTEAGRRQIAAETALRMSADPDHLAARLGRGIDDPSARLPGQPVTSAQAARDPGLAILERGMRESVPPANAPVGAFNPATAFRDMEARRDAGRVAFLDDRVPPVGNRDTTGAELRQVLFGQEGERRQAVSRAYEAVDPDGTAVLPFRPVQEAFEDVLARYYGPLSGGAPRDLLRLASESAGAAETVPWRHAQNLRSAISALETEAARLGDARLGAAAREVRAAIDTTSARAAGQWVPEGRPVTMEDLDRLAMQEGAAARPDVAAALGAPHGRAQPREKSLVQWLVESGGLREQGGELLNLTGTTRARPGLINNQPRRQTPDGTRWIGGMSMDEAAQAARAAGYFPDRAAGEGVDTLTGRDLLDAIDAELRGLGVRIPGGGQRAGAMAQSAAREVDRELGPLGLSLNDDPAQVLRAFGQEPVPAGGGAPERAVAVENALTPEQAAQWSQAQALRRSFAQDFQRDGSGVSGVGQALRGGQAQPVLPDGSVPGVLLSSPRAVQQALAAAGPQEGRVRGLLRDEFMRRLRNAAVGTSERMDSAGNAVRTALPGAANRFLDQNMDVARLIFDDAGMSDLRRFAADLSETTATAGAGASRGSPTAQNMLLANLLARTGMPGLAQSSAGAVAAPMIGMGVGGLIGGTAGAALGGGLLGGLAGGAAAPAALRMAYAAPARLTQEELGRMMADPNRLAAALAALPPQARARGSIRPEEAAAANRAALARMLAGAANTAAQSQ